MSRKIATIIGFCALAAGSVFSYAAEAVCRREIKARVVALDQPFMFNRLGASYPQGMVFALRTDVVCTDRGCERQGKVCDHELEPGKVKLRADKRPRPLVLRANAGDCLTIQFTNLLSPHPTVPTLQPASRHASLHIMGVEVIDNLVSDGSMAGANPYDGSGKTGMAAPGETRTYKVYAREEGTFTLFSDGAAYSGNPLAPFAIGQVASGLFGAFNVLPEGAEWYRSQVTRQDLLAATRGWVKAGANGPEPCRDCADDAWPLIDYQAVYGERDHHPSGVPIPPGTPVLAMLDANREIVHSDLTAIITGPGTGPFPADDKDPSFAPVPASPERRQPYREITVLYHEPFYAVQPFPFYYTDEMADTLSPGRDKFAINYGSAGIASQILANRFGVGPQAECTECKFEEFFLSAWTAGDPAMLVDLPANAPLIPDPEKETTPAQAMAAERNLLERLTLAQIQDAKTSTGNMKQEHTMPGFKATRAFYPDDPSNVYHAYMRDHVKMRIHHGSQGVPHVHHHHAHQWLATPDSDNGHYLDSQMITPGSAYTLELVYNGAGNRNQTVGDSIFHCHFYDHFAGGMWALFRVHDVLELGTEMGPDGRPLAGARALPDAEIKSGTPIPALVPLPTRAMAPIPAAVAIVEGQIRFPEPPTTNPGFPFFIPGKMGRRAPHPPMDFAVMGDDVLDGGLPRHLITDGTVKFENHTRWDFTKESGRLDAVELPEAGTAVEKITMAAHATRHHPSITPEGRPDSFILNGLPPQPGAPYADPAIDDDGQPVGRKRLYRSAQIQMDVVLNKKGWHYPQQRLITLWGDVQDTLDGVRPPEPFFFRANSKDFVEFWTTNLVPDYYELDDFEVRTPTDILGQHIHLVKFDVTSSDGAANGFNYEDGTFSPDEVRKRIRAINKKGGILGPGGKRRELEPKAIPFFGAGARGEWLGAQTTVQRWYADPLLNNLGDDRTIRTVFTHDHFSPSTHQQIGLYAGLLVEPEGSEWFLSYEENPKKARMYTRLAEPFDFRLRAEEPGLKDWVLHDGGPTSWQAVIATPDPANSFREFALLFGDLQHAYLPGSRKRAIPYNPVNASNPNASPWGWAQNEYAVSPATGNGDSNPTPLIIDDQFEGTYALNYRNEPVSQRVSWPVISATEKLTPEEAALATDLSFAFSSTKRLDKNLNRQPRGETLLFGQENLVVDFPDLPLNHGVRETDPYTPVLRAYAGDKIQVRTLAAAYFQTHFFTIHGVKWLSQPSWADSGYRNVQAVNLSEHFEFLFELPPIEREQANKDYFYSANWAKSGLLNGIWGLMRSYNANRDVDHLMPLPNNPSVAQKAKRKGEADHDCGCPENAGGQRDFTVYAVTADALPNAELVYYEQDGKSIGNPYAMAYVNGEDYDPKLGKLKTGAPVEPLILRANAGDCIHLELHNAFDPENGVFKTSTQASSSSQAAFDFDIAASQSVLDALNDNQVSDALIQAFALADMELSARAQISGSSTNGWTVNDPVYRRSHSLSQAEDLIECTGTSLLMPSGQVGLLPQLVAFDIGRDANFNAGLNPIQTVGIGQSRRVCWYAGELQRDAGGRVIGKPMELGTINLLAADPIEQASNTLAGVLLIEPQGAVVRTDAGTRHAATVTVGDTSFREFVLQYQDQSNVYLDGASSGFPLITLNGKSENVVFQFGPNLDSEEMYEVYSDFLNEQEPQTPIFPAGAGQAMRFRLSWPNSPFFAMPFTLYGHVWQQTPYVDGSRRLGSNPFSRWVGHKSDMAVGGTADLLIDKAGGSFAVPGDYLYRTTNNQAAIYTAIWGLLRVSEPGKDAVGITSLSTGDDGLSTITGHSTVNPYSGVYATSVTLRDPDGKLLAQAGVDPDNGSWQASVQLTLEGAVVAVSSDGGRYVYDPSEPASTVTDASVSTTDSLLEQASGKGFQLRAPRAGPSLQGEPKAENSAKDSDDGKGEEP